MAAEKLSVPKFSPGVVGMARGLVLAILTAIISALTIAVQGGHVGKATLVAVVTSVGVAVLRFIEGVLDGKAGAPASTRLLGGPPKAS
jgi:fucose permease